MKDFKLKTLAAACLLTFSAYGMEESRENSLKPSESFLYCVDDEDIQPDRNQIFKETAQHLVEFITSDSIDKSQNGLRIEKRKFLDLMVSFNIDLWQLVLEKYDYPFDDNQEKAKDWSLCQLNYVLSNSIEHVFPGATIRITNKDGYA